jgi:hypothetical protein
MSFRKDIFGFFDSPEQTTPAHDPGLETICPICAKKLSPPYKTISLKKRGDKKSYFYRTHKGCYEGETPENILELESSLINSI